MIVYVGLPVVDGRPYAQLVDSLLAEQLLGIGQGVHFLIDWEIGNSLIGHARNKIASRFLRFKQSDVLVFVDADIAWKGGELARLAKRAEPVVGGTYRQKTNDVKFHVRGPVEPAGELLMVGGIPGGFMKISRQALMQIEATRYQSGDEMYADYFPTGLHGDTYWGEDYGFCRLWREAGGEVFLDPSILLRHHDGRQVYAGDPREWLNA